VRLAVSALHRVLPLPYTGEALTAAEREMARLRRIGPADRERLARTTAAVLGRHARAVRGVRRELIERRDASSAGELAFELAGRLQEDGGAAMLSSWMRR
jgi:hypothetical protein